MNIKREYKLPSGSTLYYHNVAGANERYDESTRLLLTDNYKEGFVEYEARWDDSPHKREYDEPLWTGQDLTGKTIYVWHEQGYGDTLMMHRYLPLLETMAGIVHMELPPALVKLFEANTKQQHRSGTVDGFDYHCPTFSLPRAFGTTIENIPPPCLKSVGESKVQGGIGLCWAGNPNHKTDNYRTIPLHMFIHMLPKGLRYWNLCREVRDGDSEVLFKHGIVPAPHNDFADLSAIIANLDLVITVDTAVAHLAGSLGKPTWLLISGMPDWRWGVDRTDSPWYPSIKVYRQRDLGDWWPVLHKIHRILKDAKALAVL